MNSFHAAIWRRLLPLAGLIFGLGLCGRAGAETFSIGDKDFLLNGQPYQIRCGEMHFARIPPEYWAHRLRMAHAMGLNTVCAYLFWNLHEPAPGQFDFSGPADIAQFCRLAQAEGLHVILRPGPYACAEWDFGGLPWWFLKTPGLEVRTRDPRYLDACKEYLLAVGRQLAPLQITRGGPIIMAQVENEYGSFGNDKTYIGIIRDDLRTAGFDVPLFTCDPPDDLKNDTRDDVFCVVNIGSNPQRGLRVLRRIRSSGPLMVGEYYPGWFDSWGWVHHTGSTSKIVSELGWMLDHDVSFSIYMAHGGTTFGFNAGANSYETYTPEVTSYDYDAPINEAGWATPKFSALRELFSKHLNPGEPLPDIPAQNPVITIPSIDLTESAPLFANLPEPKNTEHPKPMELFDQAHGAILYRAKLPAGAAARLRIKGLHDYGLIFLDGQKVASLDRRLAQNSAILPARAGEQTLDVLVDALGHINFGHEMGDPKGIAGTVELETATATSEVTGWQVFNFPMDSAELDGLKFAAGTAAPPAFYRGTFDLTQTGDTFLDLGSWTKGVVWVNGHNLGRFWDVGPQQTLYCPGPWLKTGRNEIVVLELEGTQNHAIAGLAKPILDKIAD